MAVNHQAEIIQAFFGKGEKWGITIDYSLEDKPLSTMGPLRLIKDPPDNFLVMNGDILTDLDYRDFYDHHVSRKNIFTISSYQREHRNEYGILYIKDDKLEGFSEKPVVKYDVSMGIYMANRKILDYVPEDQAYGFDHLMLDLIKTNTPAHVKRFSGYWMDIGRPDDYMQAVEDFEGLKGRLLK